MENARNKIIDFSVSDKFVLSKLIGFRINSAELDAEHKRWLDANVLPLLLSNGSITLVGEASRTGSTSHNQGLSEQGASNVLAYLRQIAHRPFGHSIIAGVGERVAAIAGQRDGLEDASRRAVFLAAWDKPTPPPAPEAKPIPPTQMVEKVTSRRVRTVNHPGADRGTIHDGAMGVTIAGILRGSKEVKTKRRFPADHAVNHVTETHTTDEYRTSAGATLTYTTELHYGYGPMKERVTIEISSLKIYNGETKRSKTYRRSYPRKLAWKHTTAPWERMGTY